jgi:phosphoserine aminotransferase
MGLSILEISHRSKEFVAVMEEARALVKKLMKLGDDLKYFSYKVVLVYNL